MSFKNPWNQWKQYYDIGNLTAIHNDIGNPTATMVGSLLKLASKSVNLTRLILPDGTISRENMVDVRNVLLNCPHLTQLLLKETRLGYDGILFIFSAVRFHKNMQYMIIHEDTWNERASTERGYMHETVTCTDFLLELNSILKKNTILKEVDIQARWFRQLHGGRYSMWTGFGPLQQLNTAAIARGRPVTIRRSFSFSNLTLPPTTLIPYEEHTKKEWQNFDRKQMEYTDFKKMLPKNRGKDTFCHLSFTAPDIQVLKSFSALDPRLQRCLRIPTCSDIENNSCDWKLQLQMNVSWLTSPDKQYV